MEVILRRASLAILGLEKVDNSADGTLNNIKAKKDVAQALVSYSVNSKPIRGEGENTLWFESSSGDSPYLSVTRWPRKMPTRITGPAIMTQ
jgi:hypothetical protein